MKFPASPFPRISTLLLSLTVSLSAQEFLLQNLGVDNGGRFQVDALGTTDLALTLHRIEADGVTITPVSIELGMAGVPRTLTEAIATPENSGIFFSVGRDLATSTHDSDLDGIKDVTERQAALFLDAFDAGDASIADVFDLVPDFTISAGVPSAGAGTIEVPHGVDLYRFQGTAGTGLFFDATGHDGPLSLHKYYVIDPYGDTLGTGSFGLSDLGPVAMPFTGEYLLIVGDPTKPETGSYSMAVSLIPLPEEFAIDIGDTIALDDPAPGAGNIEAAAAYDLYRFSATAGATVFLNTLSYSGVNSINYRILDPEGSQLDTQQFSLGDMGTVELPLNGTYTLEVGEAGNASTGTYSIALTNVPAPDTFAIAVGDTISDGVPGPGAGNIEVPGAFDQYSFSATAGDKVFLETLSFSGTNTINYRLLDPNGAQLDFQQLNLGNMGTVALPLTGTYTLEVGEANNASTGTYSIALTNVPDPDNFDITVGDTISDGVPGPGAGNIEVPGAFDQYSFSATAGDKVFLETLSFSGTNTINYRLLDPNGAQLDFQQLNLGDMGTVALPLTGTYTLEVGEANNASTGTYSIALTNVPDPDTFAITVGDTISDGVPGPGAGNIEVPGAFDQYSFSATAGDKVFLETLSFSGTNTINYRLLDPNGSRLDFQQLNLGNMGTVALPLTGTYTLEVGEANNASTGTYSIALTNVPDPDTFAITVGDTISDGVPGPGAGNIEVPGAFDQYSFSATAGDTIDITAISQSGLSSVGYRLRDPNGDQVASRNFFSSANGINLALTGTYVLELGEPNNVATGTYSISVTTSP